MRILKWLGLAVLLLVLAGAGVMYSAFASNRPLQEGGGPVAGATTVKDGFVSVVILDAGGGRVALIDAGADSQGTALRAALSRAGRAPSSVAAIFLTHGHRDHTAGCRLFPGASVYALAAEAPMVADVCPVTNGLHDGEFVTVGELKVETFALPGHTPGSAAYLARGALYFGDSAGGGKDGALMAAVRVFTKDPAQNRASLKALAARLQPRANEVQRLAFAHTGPLDGLAPLTAFAAAN